MKVYVVSDCDIVYPEVLCIVSSLEKAQAFSNGKPEDWSQIDLGTWERTLPNSQLISIGEWEVL